MIKKKYRIAFLFLATAIFSGTIVAQNHGALALLMAAQEVDCTPTGGSNVGNHCWYWGVVGDNCTVTCSAVGLSYSSATRSFAGSDGTNANCALVMTAISGTAVAEGDVGNNATANGCVSGNKKTAYRETAATTAAASSGSFRRACACN